MGEMSGGGTDADAAKVEDEVKQQGATAAADLPALAVPEKYQGIANQARQLAETMQQKGISYGAIQQGMKFMQTLQKQAQDDPKLQQALQTTLEEVMPKQQGKQIAKPKQDKGGTDPLQAIVKLILELLKALIKGLGKLMGFGVDKLKGVFGKEEDNKQQFDPQQLHQQFDNAYRRFVQALQQPAPQVVASANPMQQQPLAAKPAAVPVAQSAAVTPEGSATAEAVDPATAVAAAQQAMQENERKPAAGAPDIDGTPEPTTPENTGPRP